MTQAYSEKEIPSSPLSFQLQMNSGEREVSKIYHSSWILSILVFVIDAKINYDPTKVWKRYEV